MRSQGQKRTETPSNFFNLCRVLHSDGWIVNKQGKQEVKTKKSGSQKNEIKDKEF